MSEQDQSLRGNNEASRPNPFSQGANEDAVYSEDQPEMRHVKISAGPTITKFEVPQLKRPAWPGPPTRSASYSVKKEWEGKAPVSSTWNVQPDCLEKVPLDFPLERTHREIHDCDACAVATRISEVLQKLSIAAEFDGEKAKAKCSTEDFVSFHVTLFSGGEGGQPVVVEVQRRSGPARSFMQSCRAILSAAEGSVYEPKVKKPPSFSVSGMKCLKGVIKPMDTKKVTFDSLDRVVLLLKDKRIDINVLGMEKLSILTDSDKNDKETTTIASKAVLIGDGKFCLRDDISATLERSTDYGLDEVHEEGGIDYASQLTQLALKVFANSLHLVSQAGILEGALKDQAWFKDALMPVLVAEVEAVETSPVRACAAVTCIYILSSTSQHAKQHIMGLKGREAVSEAYEFGKKRHERLASEAEKCLDSFDSTV